MQSELKNPFFLRVLAIMFILAPFGNILISLILSGRENWYEFSEIQKLLGTVAAIDWVWLFLILISGVMLLIQHRTAWLLASVSLMFVLFINFYNYYIQNPADLVAQSYMGLQVGISALVTVAALTIMLYSRYPYLDRRSGFLWPAFHRVSVRTAVSVLGNEIFQGETESLSRNGALVRLQRDLGSNSKMKFLDLIFPQLENLKVKCQVVAYKDNSLRLRFKDLKAQRRKQYMAFLRENSRSKSDLSQSI